MHVHVYNHVPPTSDIMIERSEITDDFFPCIISFSAPKRWIKTKFWEYFYNDDNMDEKGYSWPMSALNGELTSSDKEYADKVYKELHGRSHCYHIIILG